MAKVLRMPSERDLPRGARRDFVEELWAYYRRASRPTLQEIADAIAADYDTFTASKETIRRTMLGKTVPIDGDVADAIFEVFCRRSKTAPDEDRWPESVGEPESRRDWWRNLWSRALEEEPPTPVEPGSTGGWSRSASQSRAGTGGAIC
ncbi:hypothetical protein ACIQOV_42220, partial [Kitasatospora sp. NPDC091257]|uniref:hypothetical protein n=1 Tax=Kitasatospora sp. NPDC091257 TaxID=3364084 RepID=UPI003816CC34